MTRWQYTAAGLIRARRDTAGRTLKYDWDRLGRLTGLTNENGATHNFQYDPIGRLLEQTGFDGKATKYRYGQGTGRLEAVEEGEAAQELSFDAAGRITQQRSGIRKPDGKVEAEETREYLWDRNGRLARAKNGAIMLQWFHDAAGNMLAEHSHYLKSGLTAVWRHGYDPLGNRIATLRPDGHRIEHLTYGAGHVHGVLLDGEEVVSLERDDLHREIERTFKNGLTHYRRFDPAGRLQEQILVPSPAQGMENATQPADTLPQLFKRTYAYDKTGQLTRIQDSGKGEKNYRYDPIGRLTESLSPLGAETFAFVRPGLSVKLHWEGVCIFNGYGRNPGLQAGVPTSAPP